MNYIQSIKLNALIFYMLIAYGYSQVNTNGNISCYSDNSLSGVIAIGFGVLSVIALTILSIWSYIDFSSGKTASQCVLSLVLLVMSYCYVYV